MRTNFSHVDSLLANAGLLPELGQQQLQTRVLRIGPAEARALLKANRENRSLRPGRVAFYAKTMQQGGWLLTHQGIAFDTRGLGIDLQHRLHAVIASGVTVDMMVTENLSPQAFEAIDQHERRSMGDALKIDKTLVEEARFIYACRGGGNDNPTVLQIGEAAAQIEDLHKRVADACPTRRAIYTAVPVRVAAMALMTEAPRHSDLILTAYRSAVLQHTETWTPAMHAFGRQVVAGKVLSSNGPQRFDLLARALIWLDPSRARVTKLQVDDETIARARARVSVLLPADSSAALDVDADGNLSFTDKASGVTVMFK